jgi:hypothetical protein
VSQFLADLQHGLRTLGIWELNGVLVLAYVAWQHGAALVAAAGMCGLLWRSPDAQRGWIAASGLAVIGAALLAPAPVPILLAAMGAAGLGTVARERFNPDGLRWRVTGGLALYAAASLAYLAYGQYLSGLDAAAWAAAIGGQEEAQAALAQGRAFVNTLATWGLWLILPLGYLSLLLQGLLVHPPSASRPEQVLTSVRTRGQAR